MSLPKTCGSTALLTHSSHYICFMIHAEVKKNKITNQRPVSGSLSHLHCLMGSLCSTVLLLMLLAIPQRFGWCETGLFGDLFSSSPLC